MDKDRQLPNREPERSMYSAELVEIFWRFRPSHITSLGIEANRWGDRTRKEVGMAGRYGTVWAATAEEKNLFYLIPLDSIPYASINDQLWDEDRHQFVGHRARGWRILLAGMTKQGLLRPHPDLSYLLGQDTFTLAPPAFR